MAGPSSTQDYQRKRDFRQSPEPRGKSLRPRPGNPRFVIHEHGARSHHFDFRLEIGDVLKSWAIPKGPSTDPREKRLAVAVEDHPLDYAEFEGNIPAEQYGAGPVIIWDEGTYQNLSKNSNGDDVSVDDALRRGQLEFKLKGKKLKGGFVLLRAKMGGKKKNWLLIKMKDAQADARRNPVSTEPKSVRSGKTLKEMDRDGGADQNK